MRSLALLPSSEQFLRISIRRHRHALPAPRSRSVGVLFSTQSDGKEVRAEISEKKSFAVATGELFLGMASALLRKTGRVSSPGEVTLDGGSVDEVDDPDVIWEQRSADVEAERKRILTSPGFSFSAAGLLFPYHLGVAEFLLEKGYIKVKKVKIYS